MGKYAYPARFTQAEDGVYVEFSDLPNVFTDGDDLNEAMEMALDALSLMLMHMEDSHETFNEPSSLSDILPEENQFVFLVSCDTDEYRQKYGSQSD